MTLATEKSLARLAEICGPANVVTDAAALVAYQVDGVRPVAAAKPGSADEVAEVVRFAAAEKLALIPVGARSMLGIGMPPARYDFALDLTRLDRVVAYDSGDLTLSVEAGTPLAKLQAQLADHRQFLPVTPPFAEHATIGGILAANQSGPMRHFYGTPRDFVLGMEFVTAEGKRVKSGTRVVKSVAGYDLHKLLIGSLGTLGVITAVNFRTFPLPRESATFVARFAGAAAALALRTAIAQSPLQLHALEILSPRAAGLLDPDAGNHSAAPWCVAMNVGGSTAAIVQRHEADLWPMAERAGAQAFAALPGGEDAGRALWSNIREFPARAMAAFPGAIILKLSTPPSQFAVVLEAIQRIAQQHELPPAVLIRAAGVIYCALLPLENNAASLTRCAAAARELFTATEAAGGRAMIEWCPAELKRRVNVWGEPPEDFAMMRKLRSTFDPAGVFAPGRFMGGL